MKRLLILTGVALCVFAMHTVLAIDSEPPFSDPGMQVRYEQLTHELRCLVCQNETIADSDADLAADFRRQIHDMVAAGKSDAEIRQYMVARYGNFILYKPPVQTSTWALWTGPFMLLLVAVIAVVTVIRRRAHMDDNRAGSNGT